MRDNTTVQYNFAMPVSSGTVDTHWGSFTTWDAANVVYYTPPSMLPPIPTDVAEDDLEWLRKRVTEIEEFSRIAA